MSRGLGAGWLQLADCFIGVGHLAESRSHNDKANPTAGERVAQTADADMEEHGAAADK